MLPPQSDPVLLEAAELRHDLRLVREAVQAAALASAGGDAIDGAPAGTAEHAALSAERLSLESRLDEILQDPHARAAIDRALDARASSLRVAVRARREGEQRRAQMEAAEAITDRAATQHRSLTARERADREVLRAEATLTPREGDHRGTWRSEIVNARVRDEVLSALGTLRLRTAREQLRNGLLLTAQMRGIIAEALPAMRRGEPVLCVGETGGAKTALAEHLARTGMGRELELISGYGDITTAQVIGSHELRADQGATTSVFVPGPLLRAMAEGHPVILDEINAMPAEFLKRLNRILQLRPGDTFGVQEDAGNRIQIAEGFVILATANEQTPHRYRGLDRLSAELVNRFGANSYRVHYPDSGTRYEDLPAENALLAAAAVVTRRGELPPEITLDELLRVSRAAFISQQVFAGEHGEGFVEYVSTERTIDGRPGLEESVLAPRTLVAILHKVVASAGAVPLERALARFVEGVLHPEDRRILSLIIEGQGFAVRG